ncbi:MAG: hypothetical protein K8R23_14125 [Chthoniobacter sp.]|nr:hypothetical protein [Chthoniobacter sp.]
MKLPRLFLAVIAIFLSLLGSARAQIAVSISLKQRLHIRHEQVLATVSVTNNTGRDIVLEDTRQGQWFGFQINAEGDQFIAPRNPDYHLDPLPMKAGETLKRSVDLAALYQLGDFGIYSVRANIYYAGMDRYFSSKPTHIEITEGRTIWKRSAGVPDGEKGAGHTHLFTLLMHQRGEQTILYVRVEDQDDGSVFCTSPLGRMIDGVAPDVQFDSKNNLYVLQLIGLRRFALSRISVNGQFLGQTYYSVPKARPYLRKQPDGSLQLVGGRREEIAQNPVPAGPPPKLSERPSGLPR